MYAFIEGEVAEITEKSAVIDNHGIGYEIFMPATDLAVLVHDEVIRIYTYYQSNENGCALYGFLSKEEKRLFMLLIGVNGVGPKGAISLLSVLSPEDLTYAILGDNVKTITAAPGIGNKAAQKIILELKDKLDLADAVEQTLNKKTGESSSFAEMKNNVLLGLSALGFSNSDAISALNKVEISEDMAEETLLKEALKQLTR
mgnify:CR=1 FL=1